MADLILECKYEDGYIKHKTPERNWVYNAVRIGLAWPTEYANAYLCVFGCLHGKERFWGDVAIGPVRMIAEYEIDGLSNVELFNRVLDCCKTMWAEEVYADCSKSNEGFVEAFRDYCNVLDYQSPFPSLLDAPYADNFVFGLRLAYDWLTLNKTKVYEGSKLMDELSEFAPEVDMLDHPERKFNAINAYRYVLGGFQRNPPAMQKMGIGVVKQEIPEFFYRT